LPWSRITQLPYSPPGPAKTTVALAGALTGVPICAAMSSPLWCSIASPHGDLRRPNSEFTAPRTGQRDGIAWMALPAEVMTRSSARTLGPSSSTLAARASTSS
jgi:hypothetical protein